MKFLITSDLHLTSRPQDEYRWAIFPWLRQQIELRKVDKLFILGDLTDRKDGHPARLVNRIVKELKDFPCTVYVLKGNHDYQDPSAPFFEFLSSVKGLKFISEPDVIFMSGGKDKGSLSANVAFIPHERSDVQFNIKSTKIAKLKPSLVLIHQSVIDAVASNGEKMRGKVRASWLTTMFGTEVQFVSGDIHVPQQVGPLWYCGAPYPIHHGDVYDPRVLLWTDGKLSSIPRASIRMLSLYVTSVEELEKTDIREGDRVKLVCNLTRSQFGTWDDVRAQLTKILETRKAVIDDIQLAELHDKAQILKTSSAKDLAVSSTAQAKEVVDRFLERQVGKVPPSVTKYAHTLLERLSGELKLDEKFFAGDIEFRRLRIVGFQRYGNEQKLSFRGPPGFYHLSGRNEVEPQLGGNGTGKSATFAALCWCLYGKTPRGVKGPSVINWSGTHHTAVKVEFGKGGSRYRLTRTQDPNSIMLHDVVKSKDRVVTQEEVDELLGITFEQFLFTTLMAQFGTFFFDLGAMKQLDVFSRALGTNLWRAAAKFANAAAADLGDKVSNALKKEHRLKGSLQEIAHEKEALEKERTEFEAGRSRRLSKLLKKLKRLTRKKRKCERRLKKTNTDLNLTQNSLEDTRETEVELQKKQSLCVSSMQELSTKIEQLKKQEHECVLDLKVAKRGKCLGCKQTLPRERTQNLLAELKKKHKNTEDFIVECHDTYKQREKEFQGLKQELKLTVEALEQTEQKRGQLSTMQTARTNMINGLTKDIQHLLHDKAELAAEGNPFKKRLKDVRSRMIGTKKQVAETIELRKKRRSAQKAAIYWAKAFGDLRLWLIEEAQIELELECNNALKQLGLVGWTIRFDIERVTKSGTLSKGFHVFIKSPDSPDFVPWESWCGGETQRLRIAGAVGLARIIGSRRGVFTNLEIWDEPTAHLSTEGVQDLLQFLENRAKRDRKQVWIIDHNSINYGFKAEVEAVRTVDGTVLKHKYVQDGE